MDNIPGDSLWIVTKDGQRVSRPMKKEQAEKEADDLRKRLHESLGDSAPEVVIKQNLLG